MTLTPLGRWSGWLLLASAAAFATLIVAYNTSLLEAFGQGTGGGVALWIATAVLVVGTLVAGALGYIRAHDHSVVVVAAIVFGLVASAILVMGAFGG